MPGTAASASETLTRAWPAPMRSASTTSTAAGRSKLLCSTRLPLTTTLSSVTSAADSRQGKAPAISTARRLGLIMSFFLGRNRRFG